MSPATQPPPDWIVHELKAGMKKMLTLGWEGQPSADVIGGTLAVWIEAICKRRVFDEATDAQRFRDAFVVLIQRESRWPSPTKFLDALPSNVVPFHSQPKLDSDENRQRGLRHIKEINKIIGYHPPGRDDDPEPPKAA